MEPLTFYILLAVLIVVGAPLYYGYNAYAKNYIEPRKRRQALSSLAHKVADHNVKHMMETEASQSKPLLESGKENNTHPSREIVKMGIDIPKALQETFGTIRTLPDHLSLSDVLKEEHPINKEVKSWFSKYQHPPFYTGPFEDDLTQEEWSFVQGEYQKALQERLNAKLNTKFRSQEIERFEIDARKEIAQYMEARKELHSDPFAEDFEKLSKNSAKEKP